MDPISMTGAEMLFTPQATSAPSGSAMDGVRGTARELEGVFIGLLLKAMRSTVGQGGLFQDGTDTQAYREMFDQEMGRTLARAGGIGLTELILRDQALRQVGGDRAADAEGPGPTQATEKTGPSAARSENR